MPTAGSPGASRNNVGTESSAANESLKICFDDFRAILSKLLEERQRRQGGS